MSPSTRQMFFTVQMHETASSLSEFLVSCLLPLMIKYLFNLC